MKYYLSIRIFENMSVQIFENMSVQIFENMSVGMVYTEMYAY